MSPADFKLLIHDEIDSKYKRIDSLRLQWNYLNRRKKNDLLTSRMDADFNLGVWKRVRIALITCRTRLQLFLVDGVPEAILQSFQNSPP